MVQAESGGGAGWGRLNQEVVATARSSANQDQKLDAMGWIIQRA